VSPEEELELRQKQKNFVPKLVLTLHETDSRWHLDMFVGTDFPLVENARVFVSPKKIRDDEFFQYLKALTSACQTLLEQHEKEKS